MRALLIHRNKWFGFFFPEDVNLGGREIKKKKNSHFIPDEELGVILAPEVPRYLPGAAAQLACACAGPPAAFPAAHDVRRDARPVCKQGNIQHIQSQKREAVENKRLKIIWDMYSLSHLILLHSISFC